MAWIAERWEYIKGMVRYVTGATHREKMDKAFEELTEALVETRFAMRDLLISVHAEQRVIGDHSDDFMRCIHPDCINVRKYLIEHEVM